MIELTALLIQKRIVPDNAAAMPNLPLFRMFMATLKPPPTPGGLERKIKATVFQNSFKVSYSLSKLSSINIVVLASIILIRLLMLLKMRTIAQYKGPEIGKN